MLHIFKKIHIFHVTHIKCYFFILKKENQINYINWKNSKNKFEDYEDG